MVGFLLVFVTVLILILLLLSRLRPEIVQVLREDVYRALLSPRVLPILLVMLIPVTVAGWGLREATAAGVWMAMGLPAEQGVAVAVAYGVVVLLASLPGVLALGDFAPDQKTGKS